MDAKNRRPQTAIAYYYRACVAFSDDEKSMRLKARMLRKAKAEGLVVQELCGDLGGHRLARTHALRELRDGKANVLIVPSLRHLSRKPAQLVELVDEAFSGFKAARLLTCDGEFDSDKPAARACWPILRAVTEFESELGYQLKGVTVH